MALSPVDKSEAFIQSGMTLISDLASEKHLRKVRKNNYKVPEDRLSRPCGGANGFDDYVERFEEWDINNIKTVLCPIFRLLKIWI